jgi:hypothetical protein
LTHRQIVEKVLRKYQEEQAACAIGSAAWLALSKEIERCETRLAGLK